MSGESKVLDPVCGMEVVSAKTPHTARHEGETYYFCSAGCEQKFRAEPAKYLGEKGQACCHGHASPASAAPAVPGAKYTCPMHPEVVQDGPGACPICGMALEPMAVTREKPENAELKDMTRRFWIGLVFALPLFLVEMGSHLLGFHVPLEARAMGFLQLALASPVVLWAGLPFFERGWASLQTRNLNMFTLIAIGTGAAYLYSLVAVFAP
ncbi:MAG: YHS domain-containing protein, partial [Parvibaculum sp.]